MSSSTGKDTLQGLKDTEIPIVSRIVSVTDAIDAMVSSRPYRKGLPFEEAMRRLSESSGTQFDPAVVKCFYPSPETRCPWSSLQSDTSITYAL